MAVIALRPQTSESPGRGTVKTWVDDSLRRFFVHIVGPASGKQVSQGVCAMLLNRPDAAHYDILYDIREYTGDVTADDVGPIVAVYAECKPDLSVPCRTVFATKDPNFNYWAAAMDSQFMGRKHKALPTLEEATAWLDEPLEQRQ